MAIRTNPSSSSSSRSTVGQNKSVVGELKGVFLTRDAKTSLMPRLDSAIKTAENTSSNTSLTPDGLQKFMMSHLKQ